MRNKFLLAIVAMLLCVFGLTAQTPYAVYCEGDQSLHFLVSDTKLSVGETLASNGLPITEVYYVLSSNPNWNTTKSTEVVIEESFKNHYPETCSEWFKISSLKEIKGLENLNTTIVTDMTQMFAGCSGLTSLDVSNFNTENVTTMRLMFSGCSGLTSLDVSNFNTDKVTDMEYMFNQCATLTSLDVSNFNTENVTTMQGMFTSCSSLTSLDVSKFKTDKVIDMKYMFKSCSSLTSLDVSKFNTDNVTGMVSIFSGCSGLTSLDVSNFKTDKVKDMNFMFQNCSSLTSLDVSNFNTDNVTGMQTMFSGCSGLTSLDVTNFNTENVTNMGAMFSDCRGLTSLDVTKFNTENVKYMSSMFSGCSGLISIDVSNFKTENVTTMQYMFSDCSALTSLDLRGFNTVNVTDMNRMFANCSALTAIDLSSFNTVNVGSMVSMFDNCSSLVALDLSNFNITTIATFGMFDNCPNLRFVDFSQATFRDYTMLESYLPETALIFVPEGIAVTEGRANIVAGDKCEKFVLNYGNIDTKQLLLNILHPFSADKVTVNRTFAKDKSYTLYLPFAMDAAEYGTFYTGGELNEEGDLVTFTKVTDASTTPDTPYMFIPNQDFAEGITIEGPVAVTNLTGEMEEDGLQGVYEKKEFTADEAAQKLYYGWANGEFLWAEEGAKLDACRAYFKLPASAVAKAPARIKAIFGDDTTGVNDIDSETDGLDSPIFNLNGQRVGNEYRGILIKKGKKTANFTR